MPIKRNAEGKIIAKKFSLRKLQEASNHYYGFCLACGAKRECCEPDARKYDCEACGMKQVYGAEELIMRQHWGA
jgi:hypothetical protein